MNPFTLILLRWLLQQPDIKETAKTWLDTEPNRDRRAVAFAGMLRDDFEQMFTWAGEDAELIQDLCSEVLRHVNFRRLADELLDRFASKLLAGYLSTPSVN